MYYEKENAYKNFYKDLREDRIPAVIILCGIEQFLVNWALSSILKKYINPASESFDYVSIDGEYEETRIVTGRIIESAETYPLFSPKKIVEVKNFPPISGNAENNTDKEEVKSLSAYMGKLPESTILIFTSLSADRRKALSKAIVKNGKIYNFDKLSRGDLESFAAKRFREAGTPIGRKAMDMLLDETGYFNRESDYDLYSFENDIRKIIAFSAGEPVEDEAVSSSILGDDESFVFELMDAVTAGRKGKAFSLLNNIVGKDEKNIYNLIGLMVSQFELMLSMRQMMDDGMKIGEITERLGVNKYRLRKLLPHVEHMKADKISSILKQTYRTDSIIKTGLLSGRLALEMLIAGI
jgi:DNA polymerase-3 subunit delta